MLRILLTSQEGTPYLGPQVLVNVNHTMDVMAEESFGPVIGIMKVRTSPITLPTFHPHKLLFSCLLQVSGDDEAIKLMNDSQYGLTAIICTTDDDAAVRIGNEIETGTWFANKCDYVAPSLAWVGIKDSGRGAALGKCGYDSLTRPKSLNLRHVKK